MDDLLVNVLHSSFTQATFQLSAFLLPHVIPSLLGILVGRTNGSLAGKLFVPLFSRTL